MDRGVNTAAHEHLVDIPQVNEGDNTNLSTELHHVVTYSNITSPRVSRTSSVSPDSANSGNGAMNRSADNYARRNRNPLNSGFWISVELVVNVTQIVAAIIIICLSRNEHPHAPLFEWIIGYTAGCVVTLPHLYWRYIHHSSQGSTQESIHSNQINTHNNTPEYRSASVTANSGLENNHSIAAVAQVGQNMIITSPRINALFDHFKMGLDCFFAGWFVVGTVWIFGGHSSPEDAPNLYWLCMVFLVFNCVGYAMPFILCATVCCCLPCIIYPSWVFEKTWDMIKVPLLNQSMHSQPTNSNPRGRIVGERAEVTQVIKVTVGYLLLAQIKRELYLLKILFAAYAWLSICTTRSSVQPLLPQGLCR